MDEKSKKIIKLNKNNKMNNELKDQINYEKTFENVISTKSNLKNMLNQINKYCGNIHQDLVLEKEMNKSIHNQNENQILEKLNDKNEYLKKLKTNQAIENCDTKLKNSQKIKFSNKNENKDSFNLLDNNRFQNDQIEYSLYQQKFSEKINNNTLNNDILYFENQKEINLDNKNSEKFDKNNLSCDFINYTDKNSHLSQTLFNDDKENNKIYKNFFICNKLNDEKYYKNRNENNSDTLSKNPDNDNKLSNSDFNFEKDTINLEKRLLQPQNQNYQNHNYNLNFQPPNKNDIKLFMQNLSKNMVNKIINKNNQKDNVSDKNLYSNINLIPNNLNNILYNNDGNFQNKNKTIFNEFDKRKIEFNNFNDVTLGLNYSRNYNEMNYNNPNFNLFYNLQIYNQINSKEYLSDVINSYNEKLINQINSSILKDEDKFINSNSLSNNENNNEDLLNFLKIICLVFKENNNEVLNNPFLQDYFQKIQNFFYESFLN